MILISEKRKENVFHDCGCFYFDNLHSLHATCCRLQVKFIINIDYVPLIRNYGNEYDDGSDDDHDDNDQNHCFDDNDDDGNDDPSDLGYSL